MSTYTERRITSLVQQIEACADSISSHVSEGEYRQAAINAQDLVDTFNELNQLIESE